MNDGIELHVLQ